MKKIPATIFAIILFPALATADNKKITGTVKDEYGNPLQDANISIQENNGGTTTNENGVFTLENVPDNATISVSFTGYTKQTITDLSSTPLNITLKSNSYNLNEVEIFGTDKNESSNESSAELSPEENTIPLVSQSKNPPQNIQDVNTTPESEKLEKEKQQINQNRIAEPRKNLQKTKDVETSDANKLISASGMGVTGAGAMMAASALAEQNADADAELDMTAYLATFTCDYGIGRNIRGGETNVELPGGNNLISLRQNYISLATDLRERKTVLNMAPGIESEEIYDSATGGLYDNASVGKTSGAFTSLARALTDETSADAIAWVSQKEETAEKLKSGLVTAGIGAAGSLTANLIWNRNSYNENSDAINAE